jgi:hypothetical protein
MQEAVIGYTDVLALLAAYEASPLAALRAA